MLGFQGGVSIPLVKGGVKAPPAKRQCRAGPKAGARRGFTWLQVLGTAERSQIHQRVRHQLHAIVPLLDAFKPEQQPLEFVLPGKGPLDSHA